MTKGKVITEKKGFSLIELMITMAVSSIVMLGIGSMSGKMASNYNDVAQKIGLLNLINEFVVTTTSAGNCNTLFNPLPTGFNYTQATSATGWPLSLALGGENLADGFTSTRNSAYFQTLRFQMPSVSSYFSNYVQLNTITYFGLISYTAQRLGQKIGGIALRPRILGSIAIRVGPGNDVQQCLGMQSPEFRCITSLTSSYTWDISTNTCIP